MPGTEAHPLLKASGLTRHFKVRTSPLSGQRAVVRAVDDVSFAVGKGETLGIVGESGCGKSTTARLLIGLMPLDGGDIELSGRRLGDGITLRQLRRQVQMVFQDSYASLNPRLTILDSIAFGLKIQGQSRRASIAAARDMLAKVGLDPARFADRYPHELSGGQRQRANIARALVTAPELVILDEAVSALDKSVEAQVLNLLGDLKRDLGLTYIFISHDLNVVRYVSDDVAVMYLGEIVEIGPAEDVFSRQAHPYTASLVGCMPSMDPDNRTERSPVTGEPPNPINPPSGCRFHPRCPFAEPVCTRAKPRLARVGEAAEHRAACHIMVPGSGHSRAGEAVQ